RNMRVDDFDKYLYTMLGAEAVEQLFRVASGLDSMLIGEPEIVAQVKQALQLGERAGSIGPHLGRLFRMALQTGKRARTDTAIGRDVVSLGAAAVELAQRHCDLSATRCTVLGAGKMGAIVAKHLHARSARSLIIVNRTLKRARTVADPLQARVAGLEALPAVLAETDLLITAVGSGKALIDAVTLALATIKRQRPLLIIDIGVPHDVELGDTMLPQIALYRLEDLREIVDQTLHGRRAEIPAVEAIIAHQVQAYTQWYRTRGAAPLIASLRSKAEAIRDTEIQRLFARLPELDERQRELVISASVSIINKLLHAPVTKLRESVTVDQEVDEAQLLQAMLDLDVFSDRLQRQLDAHTAPFFERTKKT
ncbi:MAG TPA: glutamyl-tRNA reductase, partial [Candidatus Eremiobacteraceae bacterium]|nr:glutamyl-tRNA reductase [Candidatus Eremiobacteraceae bacterium]